MVFQAQSDDDDVGDDVAVNVDAGGFMDEFFEQVNLLDKCADEVQCTTGLGNSGKTLCTQ